MKTCKSCKGTGLITKGFWRFKRSGHCNICAGSGGIVESSDREKRSTIDGDPSKLQAVFHVMAKARNISKKAEARGKRTFDVYKELKKTQARLREKDYEKAMDHAKKALAFAEKLG